MSEESAGKPKLNKWPRRVAMWVIGFFISLAIGWVAERVTEPEFLAEAKQAQADWIEAVSQTSPIAVVTTYWSEITSAFDGKSHDGAWAGRTGDGQGIGSPVVALVMTLLRFFYDGGVATLVQVGLGALAFCAFNFWRSKGQTILFEDGYATMLAGPPLIILAASVIGLILQGVMLGALYTLSWITGLAAAAAGATGVVGFCWFCVTKLGEKGAEHVLTPEA